MKYRRLPVEWYVEWSRSYGFCLVDGQHYAITCIGRSWVLDEVFVSESCLTHGEMIGHGEVGPSRSPRLAAVKALRRHLGLIDCRGGWERVRSSNYVFHPAGNRYAWLRSCGREVEWLICDDDGFVVVDDGGVFGDLSGVASTPEAAASEAERALGVSPC